MLTFFIVAILLTIIAPFFDVPELVKKGKLTYHAAFLLSEPEHNNIIKIHGGTLFDYYFFFRGSSEDHTKTILIEYLKGLLKLSEQVGKHVQLEGTSYILNDRTAEKIGFTKAKTNQLQHLILAFNFFNLMATLSFAKGKLQVPNITRTYTYTAIAGDIQEKAPYIRKLISRLESPDQAKA